MIAPDAPVLEVSHAQSEFRDGFFGSLDCLADGAGAVRACARWRQPDELQLCPDRAPELRPRRRADRTRGQIEQMGTSRDEYAGGARICDRHERRARRGGIRTREHALAGAELCGPVYGAGTIER